MTAAKHKMQLYMFILLFMLTACSSTRQPNGPAPSKEETVELLNYLEENGNLLNSPYLPSLVNAGNLYHSLHGANIQIIDLRPADEFAASHIEHSVNVRPSGILNHFEQVIDPGSFDFIVLVCPNAMLSAYVNSVLLLLGYDNVLTLRFGLSSWDHGIAEGHWLAALSSHLEGTAAARSDRRIRPERRERGPYPRHWSTGRRSRGPRRGLGLDRGRGGRTRDLLALAGYRRDPPRRPRLRPVRTPSPTPPGTSRQAAW